MRRILLFTKDDAPIGELAQADVAALLRTEELNGENSLDIATSRVLEKGWRVLIEDGQQKWREYVIEGVDATHQDGGRALGKYHATSSMQHDLSGVTISKMPGVQTPVAAGVALTAALSGTKRWKVGDVTQTGTGGASMYQVTSWEALGIVTEVWGGEAYPQVTVDKKGVVSRKVGLASQMGKRTVTRRFDYGHDVRSISRKVAEEPTICRIVPRGKGLQTEDGGIERKLTIESVNQGNDYLENAQTAQLVRLPDGSGGWEYPTRYVDYPSIEDAAELKAQALKDLDSYTTPKVTYEASVVQLSQAGMDVKGIALGDDVQCVDRRFMDEGLRVQGRVTRIVTNELDETDVAVTIGYLTDDVGTILARRFSSVSSSLSRMSAIQTSLENDSKTTKDYLDNIIDNLNREINASGGYTYITEGEGIRTYDRAVSDPLVGREANQVVEIKGGSIRIANSKTSSGQWEWRSVFTAGHIAADMVTAANITAGYIGSPTGNYWDLDTGELRMSNTATLGGRPVSEVLDAVDATITGVDVQYAQNQSQTTAPTSGWQTTAPAWREGYYIWQRTVTTTPDSTSYSQPTCISGREGHDGQDGTSVTILGSYDTYADLIAAHPTGNIGDGYLVQGDLYIWDGSKWDNVGTIQGPEGPQGPQGPKGDPGTAATVHSITSSVDVIRKSADGTITPGSITFTATSITGNGTASAYAGRIRVQSSANGTSWTNHYTSSADESSCTYTPTEAVAKASRYFRAILFKAGGTSVQLDQQTVALVSDGVDGATGPTGATGPAGANGADGKDAYTVLLTNESHTFAGTKDGKAVEASTDSRVIAFKGTTQVAATIGTIIGRPSGMTTTITNNGTTTAGVTIAVATAMNTRQGTLTIPVTVDGKQFTCTFSYALAIAGQNGENGEAGIGVSQIVEQYYLSTSETDQTGGSWSTEQPEWEEGKYIWTRSRVTWSDSRVTTTDPVLAKSTNAACRVATESLKMSSVNLIPFSDCVDVNHQWAFSPSVTGDGGTTATMASGTGAALWFASPSITFAVVRNQKVCLSFDLNATVTGQTFTARLELFRKQSDTIIKALSETFTSNKGTRRYTALFDMADFESVSGGVLDTDRMKFAVNMTPTTGTFKFSKMALYLGEKFTGWSVPPAESQANALDVFNRLTGGGVTQGVYMEDGKVYINGTYIKSGTIDGTLIKAGKITDAKGNSTWDLVNGTLVSKNINATGQLTTESSNYKTQVTAGQTKLYYQGTLVGTLSGFNNFASFFNGNSAVNVNANTATVTGASSASVKANGKSGLTCGSNENYLYSNNGNAYLNLAGSYIYAKAEGQTGRGRTVVLTVPNGSGGWISMKFVGGLLVTS